MGIKLLKWELRITAPFQCLAAAVYLAAGLLILAPTYGLEYGSALEALFRDTDGYVRTALANELFWLLSVIYLGVVLVRCQIRFRQDLFARSISPTRALPAGARAQLSTKAGVGFFWLLFSLSIVSLCVALAILMNLVVLDTLGIVTPLSLLPGLVVLLSVAYYAAVLRQGKFRSMHKLSFACAAAGIYLLSVLAVELLCALPMAWGLTGIAFTLIRTLLMLACAVLYLVLTSRQMKRRFQFE